MLDIFGDFPTFSVFVSSGSPIYWRLVSDSFDAVSDFVLGELSSEFSPPPYFLVLRFPLFYLRVFLLPIYKLFAYYLYNMQIPSWSFEAVGTSLVQKPVPVVVEDEREPFHETLYKCFGFRLNWFMELFLILQIFHMSSERSE